MPSRGCLEHVHHVSNDVNSVTGLTLHEHNHFTVLLDFVNGTVTLNGAINIMNGEVPGRSSTSPATRSSTSRRVSRWVIRGPDVADDGVLRGGRA